MHSTKIRTTLITLIAALGFATATIAPAVSQADKNNGTYQKTVGKKKKVDEHLLERPNLVHELDNVVEARVRQR